MSKNNNLTKERAIMDDYYGTCKYCKHEPKESKQYDKYPCKECKWIVVPPQDHWVIKDDIDKR